MKRYLESWVSETKQDGRNITKKKKQWKYNIEEKHDPIWVAIVTHIILF